jgi:hypothetical protein
MSYLRADLAAKTAPHWFVCCILTMRWHRSLRRSSSGRRSVSANLQGAPYEQMI